MKSSHSSDSIRPLQFNPYYSLVHFLNGRLLARLFDPDDGVFNQLWGQRGALGRSQPQTQDKALAISHWITNILYVARTDEPTGMRAELRTSAVYHQGILYDSVHFPDRGPQKVFRLDNAVPTHGSVTGTCISTGMPIWLNATDLDLGAPRSFGHHLYRSFGRVDVSASEVPEAEIVFPICLRTGLSSVVIGALNMEYFPPAAVARDAITWMFSERQKFDMIVLALLDAHAPFLKIANDIACHWFLAAQEPFTHAETSTTWANQDLVTGHAQALEGAFAAGHSKALDMAVLTAGRELSQFLRG